MKLNSQMKNMIDNVGLNTETPVQLRPPLAALVEPGFVQVNGAIVLRALTQGARRISFSDFPDETGYESFVNHVHIEDYLAYEKASSSVMMANSISLAISLRKLLRQSFPEEQFDVIVSFQENHYTVRFYKKRTGQRWLSDNLEDNQKEALMVLST
jgi:hypothetical protein